MKPIATDRLEVPKVMMIENVQFEQIRVRVLPDGRMTRRDAAHYLGMAEKTLAMWAMDGKGPAGKRVGGRVFYFKDDLDRFIQGKEVAP